MSGETSNSIGRVLVTGPTGNVGREVVRGLISLGVPVIAGDRDLPKARQMFGDAVEYAEIDFGNPDTFPKALSNVNKIFLVRPPAIANVKKYMFPLIDLARKAGIEHIVFLSLIGVEKNPVVPHYKVEKYIISSGIPYTFLRPSYFMQNLDTTHRIDIRDKNEIIVPAGHGKTSFIDVRDIGDIAVMSLTDDRHMNKAYALTGEEALDYYKIARIFSEVLNRPIRYRNPSVIKFYREMSSRGYASGHVMVMIALYTTVRLGMAAQVTGELEKLLGRKPITLRQYVEDYKQCWLAGK